MSVTPYQREVVQHALAFANLRTIRSFDQVIRVLVGDGAATLRILWDALAGVPTVEALRATQRQFRATLETIATQGASDTIGHAVVHHLSAAGPRVKFAWQRGRVVQRVDFARFDVETYVSHALAIILDDGLGLVGRLGQCRWSRCGRFRLDFMPRGRPRVFCNHRHKIAHDEETAGARMAKWRANKKKKGGTHGTRKPKG